LVATALIVPVFLFRHFVQDKGRFPESMRRDLELPHARAGVRPYLALAAGVLVLWLSAEWAVVR
jgi:hypothetical protein